MSLTAAPGLHRSTGFSQVAVHGLLIVVASPFSEHECQSTQALVAAAPGLWSTGSRVAVPDLSCSAVCGILPDQRSSWTRVSCFWQVDLWPLSHQGSPLVYFWLHLMNVSFPLMYCFNFRISILFLGFLSWRIVILNSLWSYFLLCLSIYFHLLL